MMQLKNYLKISKKILLIGSLTLLSACASQEKIVVQTEIIKADIPTQARPKPVSLSNIKFYVVTKENLNEF